MATDESWGRNLRTAKRAYEERHDTRLTYKDIGKRVAAEIGRDKPFGHSAVLNWIENGQEPEGFGIVRALASILETTVEQLLASAEPATVSRLYKADSDVSRKDADALLREFEALPDQRSGHQPGAKKGRRAGGKGG